MRLNRLDLDSDLVLKRSCFPTNLSASCEMAIARGNGYTIQA